MGDESFQMWVCACHFGRTLWWLATAHGDCDSSICGDFPSTESRTRTRAKPGLGGEPVLTAPKQTMSRGAEEKFECRLLKQIQHLNSRLTETLGSDAAALCRVGSPVIVLQHMHYLKHRAHSADGVVDGCRANELCGEVRVQGELYL